MESTAIEIFGQIEINLLFNLGKYTYYYYVFVYSVEESIVRVLEE